MASMVMLSRFFPMAAKAKQKICSSSSTASCPPPFLIPENHICFIYYGVINSEKWWKYIPQKERLKVK